MTEEQMNRLLMIAGAILAALAGLGTIALLIMCARNATYPMVATTLVMGLVTVGFGWSTTFFGQKVTGHPLVFTNAAEREVLTVRQRRELRRRRGEVVMERALIEVEQEKDNIVHRAITAANDDEKPPHETQWTPNPKGLTDKRKGWEPPDDVEIARRY